MTASLPSTKDQSGNVFLFILVGIVLFAALSFVISRGLRTETTERMSAQKAALAASELRQYAQRLDAGVNYLLNHGVSEGDICTFHPSYPDWGGVFHAWSNNASCADPKNKIFDPEGANVAWRKLPEEWFLTSEPTYERFGHNFIFCNNMEVPDLGTTDPGWGGTRYTKDGMVITGPLKFEICQEINKNLGYDEASPPAITSSILTNACNKNFGTGSFTTGGAGDIILPGIAERCVYDSYYPNGYFYYYVVLAR